jgi:hypothetical protein
VFVQAREATDKKAIVYFVIFPFSVDYESVMFYNACLCRPLENEVQLE